MVIILALCIPVTAAVMGFLTLKGVQLGLKWQYELKHDEKPELTVKNPIEPFIQSKQETENLSVLSEWINGKED